MASWSKFSSIFALATLLATIAACDGTVELHRPIDASVPDGPDVIAVGPDASGVARDAMTPASDGGAWPVAPQPPGSRCNCDGECLGDAAHPGVCVYGVCMTRATGPCSSSGSRAECGEGARCWRVRDTTGHVCWPDCASFECAGTCDADGSCVGRGALDCDPACGSFCGVPPCSPENPMGPCMGADQTCLAGTCVQVCSPSALDGYCPPGSDCVDGACTRSSDCPTWVCTGPDCTDIVQMPGSYDHDSAEAIAAGYFIDTRPQYAWLRKDLTMLLRYAACEVARRFPGTNPIGIMDLSQADGYTPGTDVGDPRHPTTTHRGSDMDLAYYQTDGINDGQIVCGDGSDTNGNGRPGRYNDGYFCTTEDNIVDWPREAYWFAMLASTPLVRVFGIDRTMPDDFRAELRRQHDLGWIADDQYERALELGYGASGGWQFHHHHTHMSYTRP